MQVVCNLLPIVLCHHSPRQISLTFGQDPLYSDGDLFSIYAALPSTNHGSHHSYPHHPSHSSFQLIFAAVQAEPPGSHIIGSFTTVSSITSACQKAPAQPCSSYHFRDKVWNMVESKTMEILSVKNTRQIATMSR